MSDHGPPSVPTTQGEREAHVAKSLDDIRVGQVVALNRFDSWRVGRVRSVGNGGLMLQLEGDDLRSQSAFAFGVGRWVILSDSEATP